MWSATCCCCYQFVYCEYIHVIWQLIVSMSPSSPVSQSKCSHLCQRVHAHVPFNMHVGGGKRLSLCIINGRNVMTDDSEQPIPPPSPAQRCRLGFHGSEKTKAHTIWLINSVKQAFTVHAELCFSLSQSLSAWLKSHRTSPSLLLEDLPTTLHFI